jgi:hypothetical protein
MLLQAQVDMKSVFLNSIFATVDANRVVFLKWFPPDVDPSVYGIKIDPREIPQRCPLWFKLRGEVSGSKAYVLIGYFADRQNNQPFSAFAKSAMRLGTLSEDLVMIGYLNAYPKRIFYEVGWVPIESKKSWGASPDGIIVDPEMSWDKVPSDVAKNYSKSGIDITHGACEFKTSRTKLGMEAYFYPQLYMEMIALNVVWADLIRYRPERIYDQNTKVWTYKDVAHVYRVYRDKPTETLLMELWARAQTNFSKLKDIVQEEAYARLRLYFDRKAEETEPTDVIHMTPDTEYMYAQYYAYKHQHSKPEPFIASEFKKPKESPKKDLDLQQLANRGFALSQMNKNTHTQQMINVVSLQLEGYMQLLKNLLGLV